MADEVLDKLRSQISIVNVISRYVNLQKKGNEYTCLCPFHNDKNPSLLVSEDKKIFKCFSCGKGGDVFKFVSEFKHISYKEAIKEVCNLERVEIPAQLNKNLQVKINPLQYQYDIINKLTSFYIYSLNTNLGKQAKEYLLQRGLDEQTIKYFKIGYAPSDSTLSINYLRQKEGYSIEQLDKTKIISASSSTFKDRYSNRIIFPISNINSTIVGFSGRKFAKDDYSDAKYVNSIDSDIFKKGDLLYNFDNAKTYIEESKVCYVLEGFMDVIACYRVGVNNAVGLMGTSISLSHLKLFKYLNCEIRLLLDSDEAGQIGITKAIYQLANQKIRCVIVKPYTLAKDTDELLKLKGKEFVNKSLNELISPISFLLDRGIKLNKLLTLAQKQEFLEKIKLIYSNCLDIEKEKVIEELAYKLQIDTISIKNILESKTNLYTNSIENTSKKIKYDNNQNNVIKVVKKKPMQIIEANNTLINSQLTKYTTKYFDLKELMEQTHIHSLPTMRKIVTNERNILSRICKNYEDYLSFAKSDYNFIIRNFQTVYILISTYYEGLTSKVKYLLEDDYNKIINEYTNNCSIIDPDTNTNKIDQDYYEVINILNIFKSGKAVEINDNLENKENEFVKYLNVYFKEISNDLINNKVLDK